MKPGRPLAYGRIGDAHFFGLPGNPVAVMVTFYEFVQDALRVLQGRRDLAPLPTFKVPLSAPIKKVPGPHRVPARHPDAGRQGRIHRAHHRRPGLGHPVVDGAGELLHRAVRRTPINARPAISSTSSCWRVDLT